MLLRLAKWVVVGLVAILALAAIAWAVLWFWLRATPDATPPPSLKAPAAMAAITEQAKPNIVLIVADDLGYGQLGSFGGTQIPTPNLDTLARQGLRYTNAYAAAPLCSPSRAGLVTGHFQYRYGYEFNPGMQRSEEEARRGLPGSATTIAERLKSLGYTTGHIGKWHLGVIEGMRPREQGYDEDFTLLQGASVYIAEPEEGDVVTPSPLRTFLLAWRKLLPLTSNGEDVWVDDSITHRFTDEAVAFVYRHAGKPFFLHVNYTVPHSPLEAAAEDFDGLPPDLDGEERTYGAMINSLDRGVGKILAALDEAGVSKQTFVVFASDNGCPNDLPPCDPGGLSGFKGSLLEGAVRVPIIVRGLDGQRFEAGASSDELVTLLDIAPTLVEVAGGQFDDTDGASLLQAGERETMLWRYGRAAAIVDGSMKYMTAPLFTEVSREAVPVSYPEPHPYPMREYLFDLASDPGETRNLLQSRPEMVTELRGRLAPWSESQPEPAWLLGRKFTFEHLGEMLLDR